MSLLRGFLVMAVLGLFCTGLVADEKGLLPNPGFEDGMNGWVFRPGNESQVSFADSGPRGKSLELHPDGKTLGVETERLMLGEQLQPNQAYQVECQLKFGGLEKGVFAFSMYCFDAQGKSLQQIVFCGLNPKSKPYDWRRVRGEFGPDTPNPLPEGTKSICIRFSFYEATGDCRGTVAVDDVILRPFQPPRYAGWPREIVADVGDLQVRFESRSFWTLYRIDYQKTRLCLDRWGSHYGTVASFPGVGFIGTGHTENENEQIVDVNLTVDGQPVEKPAAAIRCEQIRLAKKSRIRSLALATEIEVRDNRIVEDVRLKADQPTPVTLVYHFMHPWTQTATEYCAELSDGTRMDGLFKGDGGTRIDKATRWSALYDGPSAKGAVTYVLDVPPDDDWRTRYWDTPDRYRKHYLVTFLGKIIPANQEFHYRVATVPFAAPQETWKQEAARVAQGCKKLAGGGQAK